MISSAVSGLAAQLRPSRSCASRSAAAARCAGHRIAGSDSADVVLRVHPQHQPGVALVDRASIAAGSEVVANGRLNALSALTRSHRNDVDAVQTNVELPQRRDHSLQRDGRRQRVPMAMPARLACAVDGDHGDQLAVVLADADRLAAELATVIDRRGATDSERFRVGVPVPDPGDRRRRNGHSPVGQQSDDGDDHRQADTDPQGEVPVGLPGIGQVTRNHQQRNVNEEHRGYPRPRQGQPVLALCLHSCLPAVFLIRTAPPNNRPASSNAPPKPPAATHTGVMLRGAGIGGSWQRLRRIFRQDRAIGHVPGQRGNRIDDPVADLVVHPASRCPCGANQPVDDLV